MTATAVGTIPSFELNRRWVWGKTASVRWPPKSDLSWALSFAGLALSTLTVAAADHFASGAHLGSIPRTCVVEGASLAAFGSLWLAQFAILDKLLFRSTPSPNGDGCATPSSNEGMALPHYLAGIGPSRRRNSRPQCLFSRRTRTEPPSCFGDWHPGGVEPVRHTLGQPDAGDRAGTDVACVEHDE